MRFEQKQLVTFTGSLSAKTESIGINVRGDCIADVVIAITSLICKFVINLSGAQPKSSTLILFYYKLLQNKLRFKFSN